MNLDKQFKFIIQKTKILKNPKHRLSTFGETTINYYFLSEVSGFKDRSRLREGLVIAEKPQIITPDLLKNRFEGFGKKSKEFARWLSKEYGESFQGLEYKFRNEGQSVQIEYSSLNDLSERIVKELDKKEQQESVVIQGPDQTWQISIMKFIVDECMASFASNLRDLEEHGFFDNSEKMLKERKKEIEELFSIAKNDKRAIQLLGKKLHQYHFFKEYEDRFYKLLKG